MCFAFVIAAIIQFASVHFFTKHGSGEVFFESDTENDYLAENEDDDSADMRFSMEGKVNAFHQISISQIRRERKRAPHIIYLFFYHSFSPSIYTYIRKYINKR